MPSPASLAYKYAKITYDLALVHARSGIPSSFRRYAKAFEEYVGELQSIHKIALPEEKMGDGYYPEFGAVNKEQLGEWLRHCEHMSDGLNKAEPISESMSDLNAGLAALLARDNSAGRRRMELRRELKQKLNELAERIKIQSLTQKSLK